MRGAWSEEHRRIVQGTAWSHDAVGRWPRPDLQEVSGWRQRTECIVVNAFRTVLHLQGRV